jgi:O-antigen/teichoic acid export membrane protein
VTRFAADAPVAMRVESRRVTEPSSESAFISRARQDVVRGSLWTFLTAVLSTPIGLVANVVLARILGSHGLGRFATYTAIFAVVLAIADLGWNEATVQWLAAATARGDEAERQDLIRRCSGFHLFLSGPACAASVLVLLSGSGLAVAGSAALAVWLMQGLATSAIINTATARNALAAQILLVSATAAQVGVVTAAAITRSPATTWAVQLIILPLGFGLATLRLSRADRGAVLRPKLVLRAPSGFWTYAASACVGGLVSTLVFGRSEVLVLRADGLLADAGIFTVVTGLAGQMTGPLDSLLAPLTPIAAGLVAIDRARARSAFERSLRVTAILGSWAACVLVPLGVVAIRILYGHAFAAACGPFAALGLVSCMQSVLGPFTAFAFATRSAARVLGINLICLAADAAIAISLIPLLGLWGAVAANAVAQVVSLIFMSVLVSRRLELKLREVAATVRLFPIGVGVGAAEALICLRLRGPGELLVIPVVVAGLVALRCVLTILPQLRLTAQDVALISGSRSSRRLRLVLRVLAFARITT